MFDSYSFTQLMKEKESAAAKAKGPEGNGETSSVRFAIERASKTAAEMKIEANERIGLTTRRR